MKSEESMALRKVFLNGEKVFQIGRNKFYDLGRMKFQLKFRRGKGPEPEKLRDSVEFLPDFPTKVAGLYFLGVSF